MKLYKLTTEERLAKERECYEIAMADEYWICWPPKYLDTYETYGVPFVGIMGYRPEYAAPSNNWIRVKRVVEEK